MVLGKWAYLFWIVVVLVGMLIPLVAVVNSFFNGLEAAPAWLYSAIFCGLLGDLTMRYLILRCGMYSPLIPSSARPALPVPE